MTGFNPDDLLRVLHRHDVRFVLIGGLAAALHGSVTPTFDTDITPAPDRANLARLSAALTELDARIRVDGMPEGVPFAHDAASLAQMRMVNLVTRFGDLDVAFEPAGVTSYAEWDHNATMITVLGCPVRVASLEDIISSKESAAREKDRLQLPLLRALQSRLRRMSGLSADAEE